MCKSYNAFNITGCAVAPGFLWARVICASVLMLMFLFSPVVVNAAEITEATIESTESSEAEESETSEIGTENLEPGSETESTIESEAGTTVITGGVVLTSEAFNQLIENQATESSEEIIYDNLDEFLQQPAKVSRFEYEILKKLEYLQYAIAILIALIFLLIFRVERR